MKWQQDLVRDIRTHTEFDDQDGPNFSVPHLEGRTWKEFSECNKLALHERFLQVVDFAHSILEIGVCRNNEESSTHVFLKNKKKKTFYVGIDLDDKSYLDDQENNVYTIKNSSSNIDENIKIIAELGITNFDFILIDGWHSINQVLIDWEYTRWLSPRGIVAFHDTQAHPGPVEFLNALNTDKWKVVKNVCRYDNGIGFVWPK